MWIFGYGSLVWRPGFAFLEAHPARLDGFVRRFYQGSPDHRGTEASPGRVVTLLREPGGSCVGRAFRLSPEEHARSFAPLAHREQAGYARHAVELTLLPDGRRVPAEIFVAGPDNPHFLGPASLDAMARHIFDSTGPSGRNDHYLLELARWLEAHGVHDPHVGALADAVSSLAAGRDVDQGDAP